MRIEVPGKNALMDDRAELRGRMIGSPARQLDTLPSRHPCRGCEARGTAVCGVLDCERLAEFRTLGTKVSVKAGHLLFREGDPVTEVFTLTRGRLKLCKHLPDGHRQILGVLSSGDFLGVSVGDEHVFTAEVLEDSELCCFPRDQFEKFLDEHPDMQQELYRMAAREFAVAELQLLSANGNTAAERLAGFLLFLVERAERVNAENSQVITLPMRRVDIADHLGLTKETVNRILSAFWAARMIRLQDARQVEILDRTTIQQLARSEYED